jgi:GxxExxY protein
MPNLEYKYSDITGKIISVALEVHKYLKNGFVESVYHRSMEIEFRNTSLKVKSEF